MSESLICTIAGGSGAGKTTLANKLLNRLGERADRLAIDWYYRDLAHLPMTERQAVNYDHPDSLEVELFCSHLGELKAGRDIAAPVYDFATHTRDQTASRTVRAAEVIVCEGIHLLALESVRALSAMRVFIDVSAEVRLERRLRRDVQERGRDRDDVLRQWEEFVAPMHTRFVGPSAQFATHVVSETEDLDEAADRLLTELVRPIGTR